MARSTRPRAHVPLYADSDSDGDENENDSSDQEATPRAKHARGAPNGKAKGKKRASDVYQPGDSGSSPNGNHRVPFKTVNINDDEAEKRKRRKSAKLAAPMVLVDDAEMANGSAAGASSSTREPGDTPKANRHAKHKQQLMAVTETPVINVPLDVMSSNFEEWMKMATDNKINATNSWNFALIDYFHDMSLLRNNVDNSINFQKASCTLDGCVKIWTSRVDSVGTETGKLLSNLATEGKVEADDEDLSDNPDVQDQAQRKRAAKASRTESTLAKNVSQLRSKKLDLEFSVDPLFKKTCADFDEGGAQGLLMNHLSLGIGSEGSMRVIFDASDSMGKGREEDEEAVDIEPYDDIDLTNIRSEFLPDLSALEDKTIAPSLEGFSFSKGDTSFEQSNFMNSTYAADLDDDDFGAGADVGDAGAPMDVDGAVGGGEDVQDFFVGEQAVVDDFGYDGGFDAGGDDRSQTGGESSGDVDGRGATQAPQTGGFEPFDPRRAPNERDLLLAMTEPGANGSSLDYFDQTFLKNWAGPEHWKIRKVIRRPEANADTSANKTKTREKKEPFKIDFLTPSEKSQKEVTKEIFAPVTRGASITLPGFAKKSRKGKEKEKRGDHTLPDDMHFSSRQLVTLFLKPNFALKMRGNRARLNANDGEVDERFWAQAAADQAAGRQADDGEEGMFTGAIPFNTQFFHDEYDDGPGFDDIYDGDAGGEGLGIDAEPGERDLLAETQGTSRRVRPETVNYARRAKRVDVRKLKENIWKGLDIVVPPSQGLENEEEDTTLDSRPPTDPEEARVFTSVISGLHTSYPKDKMADISTSFCFICLLHLANERGLKLEVGEEDEGVLPQNIVVTEEEEEEETRVGNLWGLKVFRDPNAIPAA
ncbi:barren [Fomitiporia mediterranea MF3/22]|uniref:barren n=1 Tax=Fomitiporia mediterranea (strain MF3/22) TaxID=694068 RepID=UPI0004408ADA|nr:barren [Fomitiporia mediterranea MF3/22]EJD07497.1 barren [Fomitiporia mediterranea MF3/22]